MSSFVVTEAQKAIVRATVPILEVGGEALTKHFYGIMLTEHPEVVPFFNKTHQKSGDQPRALAHAVLMYAKHIDHLENIGSLAAQIINKHVSLSVRADHYPVVGSCLIRAIREVLGPETATDAVLDAWGAAYQQLADILIGAEEAVYKKNEAAVGGWRDMRAFTLTRKEVESSVITSFYFSASDKGQVLTYAPGQYIGVRVVVDGMECRRNYSLSALPNGTEYRISIKREDHGAVSTFIHAMEVGNEIDFIPPAGEFVYTESTKPLVLIGGGIGLTPLLPMMQHALATSSRQVVFIHCVHSKEMQAFASTVAELEAAHKDKLTVHNWVSTEKGRMTKDDLKTLVPADSDYEAFFVGPKGFMADIKHYLADFGVPGAQVKFEFFGPAAQLN